MHVVTMAPAPKYQPPLPSGYVPAHDAHDAVSAFDVRAHVLDLFDAGIDRVKLSALTGVHRAEISAIVSFDRNGAPLRRKVDAKLAGALLLVRTELTGIDPTTRVLAVGAQRRIQALARMGHSIETIAGWMNAATDTLERLLDPATKVTSVRAHRTIMTMFRTHWMTAPTRKDEATIARALAAGWQSPLAWDDIDFDLAPASTTLHAVRAEDIDEVAVELALRGEEVHLGAAERRAVVGRAHEQRMGDNAISVLTGIPLTTVWNIRQSLGLEPRNEPTREYEAA